MSVCVSVPDSRTDFVTVTCVQRLRAPAPTRKARKVFQLSAQRA